MKSRMVRLLAAVACGLLSLSLVAGGTVVLTAQASETEETEPEEDDTESDGETDETGSETTEDTSAEETVTAYQATVNIPVTVTVSGDDAPDEEFTVVLTALDSSNPMPETTSLTLSDGEEGEFGPITYTKPGDYKYTITQTAGSTSYMTYDTTVFYVTVRVQNNESYTGLEYAIWAYEDEDDETNESAKLEAIEFVNTYSEPSSSTTTTTTTTTDDGDDDDTTTSTTTTVTSEAEEAGSVLDALREIVGGDEEGGSVLGAEKLPQTGQLNWPIPVMAALGILFFILGLLLICREDRKELAEIK